MDETAVLTPGAHRVIRLLDGQESAYAGELITDGDRRGVRVDAESVPEVLWRFGGAEHVAGVRDMVRRSDGHDAVLPWCADRVEMFLGRRRAAEAPLSAGETVTLVGSMLRGIVEIGDQSICGQWWLTDEARPLFAPGDGTGCAESAAALIARLREGGTDRAVDRLVGEIAGAAADRRVLQRSIERWERELTELAAPRPLMREVFAPERVAAIEAHRSRLPGDVQSLAVQPTGLRLLRERGLAIVRQLRQRGAALLPRRERVAAPAGVRSAEASARPGRRRMLLTGGVAAAVVLVGGLMWPPSEEDSAATERPGGGTEAVQTAPDPDAETALPDELPSAQADAESAEKAASTPAPDAVADGSAQHQAATLLAAVAECVRNGDAVCGHAVVEGAGALVQERLAGTDAARAVTAVEDYGDVSVLRLGPSGERGEQMLVLVTHKDGWLVRDVYDVADQPSGRG